MIRYIYIAIFLFFTCSTLEAQYIEPLKIPLFLSGNFGELRNDHFHSGIDLKTQGTTNIPVYAVEKGHVSRILVSPTGFGYALYVDHPDGRTSVYAHLDRFTSKIADYVKEKQYENESFRVDLQLDSDVFPVEKGKIIAYSGNSGSSGGPHLHFEIRDTKSAAVLDPLSFYKEKIKDTRPPEIRGIAIYPMLEEGCVNGAIKTLRMTVSRDKTGNHQAIKQKIEAWGTIGVGIKAYDRMNGANNIYGVKKVRLLVDEEEIFCSEINSFQFHQSRMINSYIDFEAWRNKREFFMKSFVETGNTLPFFKTANNGFIKINEEKTYSLRYILEDVYGNQTSYSFSIVGKEQKIPKTQCYNRAGWYEDFHFQNDNFFISIPKGNLFTDICFTAAQTADEKYLSDQYRVCESPVPLYHSAEIGIRLKKDIYKNKLQYGIVKLDGESDKWEGGRYENGFIKTNIRELGGNYAIDIDSLAPEVVPIQAESWVSRGVIRMKVTDNKSGMKLCRGTIGDKFVLFENDVKSNIYSYKIDKKRTGSGKKEFVFVAIDNCGNETIYYQTIQL